MKNIKKTTNLKEGRQRNKSPYRNYYQMEKDQLCRMAQLIREQQSAGLVFQFILNNMNVLNELNCTVQTLAKCLNLSTATVSRHIKHLKENDYIDIQKNGTTNIYIVNPGICWSSWGDWVSKCNFKANCNSPTDKSDYAKSFNAYYQFNRKYFFMFENLIRENQTAALIFLFLLQNADRYNELSYSSSFFTEQLAISRTTFSRHINYLYCKGYIDIQRHGTTNVYIINPNLCWSGSPAYVSECRYNSDITIPMEKKPRGLRKRGSRLSIDGEYTD